MCMKMFYENLCRANDILTRAHELLINRANELIMSCGRVNFVEARIWRYVLS